ncbi:prepilin-type N-terminal cleavage/methylation domain-containing protein [bacterium]|nr:prepilin-type N-terminal cleavage/methylation domain-containing protein [bacterium]
MKFSIFNFQFSKRGFTLIEVLTAISVMTIGILGIYALVPRVISISGINTDRFIASQLAREGIEIVRNIRDGNALEGVAFDEGLSDGNWRVQYDKDFLLAPADEPLKMDANGFYNYDSGSPTKFKRKVILSHLGADSLKVKVEVSWPGSGSPLVVEENLHNWR